MKIKSRKMMVFFISHITLALFFFITLKFKPELLTSPVIIFIVLMTVLNGINLIGGNVLDKWTKSKYFRSELYREDK